MGDIKGSKFEGKVVFVGLDVHKKTYAVVGVCDGVVVKKATVPASPEALSSTLFRAFPGAKIHSAYEAGFSGFVLHRYLVKQGICNIVVNPASILTRSNDRVKTDKRDALAIAQQLAVGLLKAVYVPDEGEELARSLSREREQLIRDRTRTANRIKSKLLQYGIKYEDFDKALTNAKLTVIEKLEMPKELMRLIARLIAQYRFLNDQVKEVEGELAIQAKEGEATEKILRSVPGVGKVTSRVLATEIINIKRFKNQRQLASYFGLTPREYSSGDKVRRGSITKQGNSVLRHCLIEASWVAIRIDQSLRTKYELLKARRGGNKAIVAVARSLLMRIAACLHNEVEYWIPKAA